MSKTEGENYNFSIMKTWEMGENVTSPTGPYEGWKRINTHYLDPAVLTERLNR
jgi:hypothetical protein